MNYIFLIAAFNAIFFSILLLQKKPREFHDNILISWLLDKAFVNWMLLNLVRNHYKYRRHQW